MHIRIKNEQELKELMDDDEYDVFLKELAGLEQGEDDKIEHHPTGHESLSGTHSGQEFKTDGVRVVENLAAEVRSSSESKQNETETGKKNNGVQSH